MVFRRLGRNGTHHMFGLSLLLHLTRRHVTPMSYQKNTLQQTALRWERTVAKLNS